MIPEEQITEQAAYEQKLRDAKKTKKKILIAFGAILAVILFLFLLIFAIEKITASIFAPKAPEYKFYPTYTGDIMKNQGYLNLNRDVVYAYDSTGFGFSTSITEDEWESFDGEVRFLYNYLQIIISGDSEAYNACLSQNYIKKYGTVADFPPQMLYEMKISYYRTDNDGGKVYKMEYKFYRNDGTFRDDVGSGMSRPQYIKVVKDDTGAYKIENIATQYEVIG
ncbi:MAG: hypothetical protein IIX80_02335 [Clostridia bacterium]|nr:hypothetical protein [Clostridia bacterium]